MNAVCSIFKREFMGYFRSPVAYVFLAVFLVAEVGLPWFVGGFFEGNQATLERFFTFLPWVFLFLIPAVGMRLWSDVRRAGTWALLFTVRRSVCSALVGIVRCSWVVV